MMNYTEKELMSAARDAQDSLSAVLREARYAKPDPWSREQLEYAGRLAGYTIMMKSILDRIDGNREKEPFTHAELTAALKRNNPYARPSAEVLIKDILDHREPEYPVGTVVLSAANTWYRRVARGWQTFGAGQLIAFEQPTRPLAVKS